MKRPATSAKRAQTIVGIDTGGTFTDLVLRRGTLRKRFKLLSTPANPAVAVLEGLKALLKGEAADLLTYGTTVATNAMLERRGAKTALVTTAGFEDLIEIGRQARTALYSLEPAKVAPVVPRRLRLGLKERMLYDGKVEQAPTAASLDAIRRRIKSLGVESVAVCLLHSHINGRHESTLAEALAGLDLPVTLSHQLSPMAGEYERSSTAAANAYLRPLLENHLAGLAAQSGCSRLRVMQSAGGSIGWRTAAREPVRTLLSGPAGGVAAAFEGAAGAGHTRIVTLDMGGTSTDVALVDGELPNRNDTEVAGIPVKVPSVDIHTVGAGGGSIAWVDEGGCLQVGPLSAGAEPGPACYGRGREATVTDANVVLGRLRPKMFLGGTMQLDSERAQKAIERLAGKMGAASIEEAAEGVIKVVEANMERAMRLITIERGHDPRGCVLFAFGGAAGLHACSLAASMGMAGVVLPTDPGLLSAAGVMEAAVVRDITASFTLVDPAYSQLRKRAEVLERKALRALRAEGVKASQVDTLGYARMRYLGQSVEFEVPLRPSLRKDFHLAHERRLRYSDPGHAVEVCGLRVRAVAATRRGRRRRTMAAASKARPVDRAPIFLDGRRVDAPVFDRSKLAPGARLRGPAIVVEYSSTTLAPATWRLEVDAKGLLKLQKEGKNRG